MEGIEEIRTDCPISNLSGKYQRERAAVHGRQKGEEEKMPGRGAQRGILDSLSLSRAAESTQAGRQTPGRTE